MDPYISSHENHGCKFNIPEGLNELMSDISREVLRAQPSNICLFVANYLSALLVTREHLHIATRICACIAGKDLDEMLKEVGITDEDVAEIVSIVDKYFDKPKAKESQIMSEVFEKVTTQESDVQLIQNAVRAAIIQHNTWKDEITKNLSAKDDVEAAIQHTLDLYKKTKPSVAEYNRMEKRIEAAYRAYGVERHAVASSVSTTSDSFLPYLPEQSGSEDYQEKLSADTTNYLFYEGQEIGFSTSGYSFLDKKIREGLEKADSQQRAQDSNHRYEQVTDSIQLGNRSKQPKPGESDSVQDRNVKFTDSSKSKVTSDDEVSDDDYDNDDGDLEDEEIKTHFYKKVIATSLLDIEDIDAVDEDPIDY